MRKIPDLFKYSLLFLVVLLLGACGGDSDDSPPDEPAATTSISGTVQAPVGAIAWIETDRPVVLVALDFVLPPAWAAVTGLTPVANARVELLRIDDNGSPIGSVLASTTTGAGGEYTLELPAGVTPAANLIVQIRNSSDQPVLRAMVTGDSVDIDPVSQFILDTLINEPGVVLSTVNLQIVQALVQQVAAIEIDLSSVATLEDAGNAIGGNSQLSQAVESAGLLGDFRPISGAFAFGDINDPGLVVFYPDGVYVHWQDCTNSDDGVGVEYGRYHYDGTTFSASPEVDQNGGCGLSEWQAFPVSVDDTQLTFQDNGQSLSLPRNADGPDSIVGAWDVRATDADVTSIVFYASGLYVQYQAPGADPNCAAGGIEYGTYEFDGSTISGNIMRDDNQSCGLGEGTGGFSLGTVTVADDVMTFGDGGGGSVARVGISTSPVEPSTAFTFEEVANSTFYSAWPSDEPSCGTGYIVSAETYTEAAYSMSLCDGGTEVGTFDIVDGDIRWNPPGGGFEFTRRISLDNGAGGWVICTADSPAELDDCSLDAPIRYDLFTDLAAAQAFAEQRNAFSINLVGRTATSVVTSNEPGCAGVEAGFSYTSFTATTMNRTGADGFDTDGFTCAASASETQSIEMTGLAPDFDIPFNCAAYPVCTSADLNKTLVSQVEGFTAFYGFNPDTNVLSYVYEQSGRVITEIITISD